MDALKLLRAYESDSEDEFLGFPETDSDDSIFDTIIDVDSNRCDTISPPIAAVHSTDDEIITVHSVESTVRFEPEHPAEEPFVEPDPAQSTSSSSVPSISGGNLLGIVEPIVNPDPVLLPLSASIPIHIELAPVVDMPEVPEDRPVEVRRKKTKKEVKREDSAKKRRLAHDTVRGNCDCLKICGNLLSQDDRNNILKNYWKLDLQGQRSFVQQYVHTNLVNKRRRRHFKSDLKKKTSYICTLPAASGDPVRVCRKFFLSCIGYGENCGNIIYRYVNENEDRRGKYGRNSDSRDAIKAHILTYEPSVSHYRREHAPNRLYLPSDLTKTAMYQHFKSTTNIAASYQLYSRILKDMNISFVKLGHEECEVCVAAAEHKNISKHSGEDTDCNICSNLAIHMQNASVTRAEYRSDGDAVQPDELVISVDLQKVIQLPRLDGLKTIVFSQRVLAFNETFAPVGEYAREYPVVACVWPESISGRNANDILSCFYQVILKYGHLTKLTRLVSKPGSVYSMTLNYSFVTFFID